MRRNAISLALCLTVMLAQGQGTNKLQSVGFNSTFALSAAQIEAASLSADTAADVEATVRFDRSQLANGGAAKDAFYTLPALGESDLTPRPGRLLKVQTHTDPAPFTLPANTALSRFLYTTTNLNGTVVPASAFVLWPFSPRAFSASSASSSPSRYRHGNDSNPLPAAPVVLWTHGTSGFFASHAPSTHRALWYAHAAPFALALDGYAVVAPDYAGLGIAASWDGTAIPHQYLASRVSARDGLYALRAAHEAFAGLLSEQFVAFGHSQGGGAAWGVAEVLKEEEAGKGALADLRVGFRGTVAVCPTTDLFTSLPQFIIPWLSVFLRGIFPSFDPAEWLSPLGIARVKLLRDIEGGIAVSQSLFLNTAANETVLNNSYNETWYVDAYGRLANAGNRPFVEPLLVIQGTNDMYVSYNVTTKTVRDTCASTGGVADLEYLVVNGTGHTPTLDATRAIWLQWIRDRFEGAAVQRRGCVTTKLENFLPFDRYMATTNSYLQWAGAPEYAFETPLGL